jgi:putative tricarboxylic transport membrane protein
MRRADTIAGAALLALAVGFSVGALKHYAYWGANGPGPAFLPFWLGAVMGVLAVTLLVGALRTREPGAPWLPSGVGRKRLLVVLGATVALVALLNVLGMVIGSFVFLLGLMRFLDRTPWLTAVAVAAAVAAANYLVFTRWLKVPMPVSVLGF